MRIGDVAESVGTTPRTIRYYEELGLLGESDREKGAHRTYTEADVERLREVMHVRDLLGISLEELKDLVAMERPARIDRTRELIAGRRADLDRLDAELKAKRMQLGRELASRV
jgi:DNA-binding transcriptional MerR regulator